MKSKSQKAAEIFLKNPSAKPKDVGTKLKLAMPVVYAVRKRVLSGSMLPEATPEPIVEHGYIHPRVEFKPSEKANDKQFGGDHYKNMGVEPWDVVDTWPREQRIGYYRGGALKYIMRMGAKDESPIEVEKGKHYMEKLLEVLNEAE